MYTAQLCSGPQGWWAAWVIKTGERLPMVRFETGTVAEAMGQARRLAKRLNAQARDQEAPLAFLDRCRHAYGCATGGPMCRWCHDPAMRRV